MTVCLGPSSHLVAMAMDIVTRLSFCNFPVTNTHCDSGCHRRVVIELRNSEEGIALAIVLLERPAMIHGLKKKREERWLEQLSSFLHNHVSFCFYHASIDVKKTVWIYSYMTKRTF